MVLRLIEHQQPSRVVTRLLSLSESLVVWAVTSGSPGWFSGWRRADHAQNRRPRPTAAPRRSGIPPSGRLGDHCGGARVNLHEPHDRGRHRGSVVSTRAIGQLSGDCSSVAAPLGLARTALLR